MSTQISKKKIIFLFFLITLVVSVSQWKETFQESNIEFQIKHNKNEDIKDHSVRNPLPLFEGYKEIEVKDNYAFIISTYPSYWHCLRVYNLSDLENIQNIYTGENINDGYVYNMKLIEDYLYIKFEDQLQIYNVTNVLNIEYVNAIDFTDFISTDYFTVKDGILSILGHNFLSDLYLTIISHYNISDKNNIVNLGNASFIEDYRYNSMLRVNNNFFLRGNTYSSIKLLKLNLENLTNPIIDDSLTMDEDVRSMTFHNNMLFLAHENNGLTYIDTQTFNITGNFNQFENSDFIKTVIIENDKAYLTTNNTIAMVNIMDLEKISLQYEFSFEKNDSALIMDIDFENNFLYVARATESEDHALLIFDFNSLDNPSIIYPDDYITTLSIGYQPGFIYWTFIFGISFILLKPIRKFLRINRKKR